MAAAKVVAVVNMAAGITVDTVGAAVEAITGITVGVRVVVAVTEADMGMAVDMGDGEAMGVEGAMEALMGVVMLGKKGCDAIPIISIVFLINDDVGLVSHITRNNPIAIKHALDDGDGGWDGDGDGA